MRRHDTGLARAEATCDLSFILLIMLVFLENIYEELLCFKLLIIKQALML